jgi:hypothetical protein
MGFLTLLSLLAFCYTVKADVSVTGPPNWQPSSYNNSTYMIWFQNSTKSLFVVGSQNTTLPLFLISGFLGQVLAQMNVLQSTDQISFGKSNFGYRYVLDLSQFPVNASSYPLTPPVGMGYDIFRHLKSIPEGTHFKAIWIISQKYKQLYTIALLTPSENFDTVSKEIQPSLDSIKITGNYSK